MYSGGGMVLVSGHQLMYWCIGLDFRVWMSKGGSAGRVARRTFRDDVRGRTAATRCTTIYITILSLSSIGNMSVREKMLPIYVNMMLRDRHEVVSASRFWPCLLSR